MLGLDVQLLNMQHRSLTKLADIHIENIAAQLKDYDYVNIQFDAALYGVHPKQIYHRFERLGLASKKRVVTMHRCDFMSSIKQRHVLKKLFFLRIKEFLTEVRKIVKKNYYSRLYARMINFCKDSKDRAVVVHTVRDRMLISSQYKFERVFDHPITFLSSDACEKLVAESSNKLDDKVLEVLKKGLEID